MPRFDLRAYALVGAQARVTELREELASIYAAFPELREVRETFPPRRVRKASEVALAAEVPAGRRRRGMTAAQRKAVSARMKKYWAAKRKTGK